MTMKDQKEFLPWENLNLDFLEKGKYIKRINEIFIKNKKVDLVLPSRIHLNLFDDSRMSTVLPWCWWIVLSIDINPTIVKVKRIKGNEIKINTDTTWIALIQHIVEIFKEIFSLDGIWLQIEVYQKEKLHMWFWSSAMKLIWTTIALNAILGFPLINKEIRKLVWLNYVEVSSKKWYLVKWYETWWASIAALYGWLTLFTDKLQIIDNMQLDNIYKVMVFVPNETYIWDRNISRDVAGEDIVYTRWKKFWSLIPATAYKVFFDLLPAMKNTDILLIWDILSDLNFMMWNIGTITNRYSPKYYDLFDKIRKLWWIITGISSTWPSVFVVAEGKQIDRIKEELALDISYLHWVWNISNWLKMSVDDKEIKISYPDLSAY